MQVFWHPGFVANFRSADKRFADEPASLASCLHKVNESVQSFRERVPRTTPYKEQILEMQSYLLGSLKNASLVGTYNKFWEWSIFKNGYDHDETLRLAYLYVSNLLSLTYSQSLLCYCLCTDSVLSSMDRKPVSLSTRTSCAGIVRYTLTLLKARLIRPPVAKKEKL